MSLPIKFIISQLLRGHKHTHTHGLDEKQYSASSRRVNMHRMCVANTVAHQHQNNI